MLDKAKGKGEAILLYLFVWEKGLDGREVLQKAPKRGFLYREVGRSGFQKAMLLRRA